MPIFTISLPFFIICIYSPTVFLQFSLFYFCTSALNLGSLELKNWNFSAFYCFFYYALLSYDNLYGSILYYLLFKGWLLLSFAFLTLSTLLLLRVHSFDSLSFKQSISSCRLLIILSI